MLELYEQATENQLGLMHKPSRDKRQPSVGAFFGKLAHILRSRLRQLRNYGFGRPPDCEMRLSGLGISPMKSPH